MLALPLAIAVALAADSVRPAQVTVCGVDRSGSAFGMRDDAVYECALVLAEAGPGDEVEVRWISEHSYAASERVVRLFIPRAPRTCGSQMDVPCRRAYRQWEDEAAASKRSAIARLLAAPIIMARSTDIMGFLQAASEVLTSAPPSSAKSIRVVTDGEDTMGERAAPNFRNTSVTVAILQVKGNVADAIKIRAAWKKFFVSHGASDVRITSAQGKN